jgi:hypothetical protein
MDPCPFCGKEYHALKNHVRLTSGGGHGPSGQYPDEFNSGRNEDTGDAKEVSNIDESRPERGDTNTTRMSPTLNDPLESNDDEGALTWIERSAYARSHNGVTGKPETLEVEGPSRVTEPASSQSRPLVCPECAGGLETGVEGIGYIRIDGTLLELEETDAVCNSCDLVVPDTGDLIYGSDYDTRSGWNIITLVVVSGLIAFLAGFTSKLRENGDDTRLL